MKPTALAVRFATIPDALKAERRWVVWRYEQRAEARWAKILCTTAGRHAKSNDPITWTSFDDALAAYRRGSFDGIGFCLGDGWSGIDLDDVKSDAGPLARLRDLGVYVETSPSATGFKALGRSSRIGGEVKFAAQPTFTTWQGARFFAITGHGAGDPMIDLTPIIDEWFPTRRSNLIEPFGPVPAYIREGSQGKAHIEIRSDDDVLLAAATATNRAKFLKLFRGDMSDYANDRSKADQALVNILIYWCNGDANQADRLFRQSELMREKWEKRSYRLATLNKAIALFRRTA